jgi:hypothetical protein
LPKCDRDGEERRYGQDKSDKSEFHRNTPVESASDQRVRKVKVNKNKYIVVKRKVNVSIINYGKSETGSV